MRAVLFSIYSMLPRQTICNAAVFHFIVIHFFITQWAVIVDHAPMVMLRRRHALLIRKAHEPKMALYDEDFNLILQEVSRLFRR